MKKYLISFVLFLLTATICSILKKIVKEITNDIVINFISGFTFNLLPFIITIKIYRFLSNKEKPKNQKKLESKFLIAIKENNYKQAHEAITDGLQSHNEEFCDKCIYLMNKCEDQDIVRLIEFFLRTRSIDNK